MSSTYEVFNLIFKVMALLGVITIVTMEATIPCSSRSSCWVFIWLGALRSPFSRIWRKIFVWVELSGIKGDLGGSRSDLSILLLGGPEGYPRDCLVRGHFSSRAFWPPVFDGDVLVCSLEHLGHCRGRVLDQQLEEPRRHNCALRKSVEPEERVSGSGRLGMRVLESSADQSVVPRALERIFEGSCGLSASRCRGAGGLPVERENLVAWSEKLVVGELPVAPAARYEG
ncbi:hypothetical protein GW17_00041751 [Ensete ventricosum]|nr:hypothetical protein GW17_00041751 [Ensete ventricosum]